MNRNRIYQVEKFEQEAGKTYVCNSFNECKRIIHLHGKKGEIYLISGIEKKTGEIWEKYEMLLNEKGFIYTRKIYDKWKMLKLEAELKQQRIPFEK